MSELVYEYIKSGLVPNKPKVSYCVDCGEEIPYGEELCIMCYEERVQ
jgi:hypothetical protein